MRILLLDGAASDDTGTAALARQLTAAATARGATVDHRVLRDVPLAWCQGCFECWTHSPGVCKINDPGRELSDAYVQSEVTLIVTRSQFGGLGFHAKKAVDRFLGSLLPFFRRIEGEVHHFPRYKQPAALGVLGVIDADDAESGLVLETLVARNALNMAAPRFGCRTVVVGAAESVRDAAVSALLNDVMTPTPRAARTPQEILARLAPIPVNAEGEPVGRALLIVGSAKPSGTSTSEALGSALLAQLATQHIAGEVHFVHREAHSPEGLVRLLAAVRSTDLILVASPLYFDALPALVVATLEAILDDRRRERSPRPLAVAGIINCGFPEAHQCAVAEAMLACFARKAHARWAGALLLGMGGMLGGRPIAAQRGPTHHLPSALQDAATALAAGRVIPSTAIAAFARPMIPKLAYVLAGDAGWLWTASHEGVLTRLWDRPGLTSLPESPAMPPSDVTRS